MPFRFLSDSRFIFLSLNFLVLSMINLSMAQSAIPVNSGQKLLPQYWQTIGYGYALEVIDDEVTFYDIAKQHCTRNQLLTSDYAGTPASQWIRLKVEGTAELNWHAIHPAELIALEALPSACQSDGKVEKGMNVKTDAKINTNPIKNFEVFWATYAEHYPYSKKQNWDWQQRYPVWRSMVNLQTTDNELADIFSQIINQIRDGHAVLEDKDGRDLGDIDTRLLAYEYRLRQAWKKDEDYRYFWPFQRDKFTKWGNNIVNNYLTLSRSMKKDLQQSSLQERELPGAKILQKNALDIYYNNFHFGLLKNNVSYLRIDGMARFTKENNYENWLLAVDEVMQQLLPNIHKRNGLIIDLRNNGGGTDLVSLRLLSYLINVNTRIGAKATMEKGQLGAAQDIWVSPSSSSGYQGPIVTLTSQGTASAAEIMLMGLLARGNSTLIGEPSNGSFSDILPKQLPNGWTFGLSNQIYFDVNGVDHEEVGFSVSEYIPFLDVAQLDKGEDLALEKAISLLSKQH